MYKVAEIKLVVVAVEFVAVTVCSLAVNVFLTATTPQHYLSVNLNVVACHGRGVESANNCDRFIDASQVLPIYILSNISLALQSCISLVILLINSNYSKYKTFFLNVRSKIIHHD